MRRLAIVIAGLSFAGPALAQVGPAALGGPPSPYGAQAAAAPQASVGAFGAPTADASAAGGPGRGLQTFDNIGTVRVGAPAATAAPRIGDLTGAPPSPPPEVKATKPVAKPR